MENLIFCALHVFKPWGSYCNQILFFFQLILLRIAVAFRDWNLLFHVTKRPFFPIIVLFLICELHCLSSIIIHLAESSCYTYE